MHVSPNLWQVLAHPGVRPATSYHTDESADHGTISGGRRRYLTDPDFYLRHITD